MTNWQRLLVLFGGFLTHQLLVLVTGFLAAITIPKTYFEFFKPYLGLALFIEETFVVAMPMFLISFCACAFVLHRFRPLLREAAAWWLGGMLVAWLYGLIQATLMFQQMTPEALGLPPSTPWNKPSLGSFVVMLLMTANWFTAAVFYAPWLGIAAAVLWLRRRSSSQRPVQGTA